MVIWRNYWDLTTDKQRSRESQSDRQTEKELPRKILSIFLAVFVSFAEKYPVSVFLSASTWARFQFVAWNFCSHPTASHGDGDDDGVLYALAAIQSMLWLCKLALSVNIDLKACKDEEKHRCRSMCLFIFFCLQSFVAVAADLCTNY
jgi:hypothetical protein